MSTSTTQSRTLPGVAGGGRFFYRGREAARYLVRWQLRELWDSNKRRQTARRDVLKLLPKHSVGAELGVFKGEFSAEILRQVQPKVLYLVDRWWDKYGDFYPNWGEYTDYGRLRTRTAYGEARKNVQKANPNAVSKVLFRIEDDMAFLRSQLEGLFDWIYIDSDHSYAHVAPLLTRAARAIQHDGLLCGDDWTEAPHDSHAGVTKAVTEFLAQHQDFGIKYLRGGQWVIGR